MTFTTTAFHCSSSWLFGVFSCKTTPKDLPSSSAQHALPRFLTQADQFIFGVAPLDYGPVLLRRPFGFRLTADTLPSGNHRAVALGPPYS